MKTVAAIEGNYMITKQKCLTNYLPKHNQTAGGRFAKSLTFMANDHSKL